jgi:hypothetical protein
MALKEVKVGRRWEEEAKRHRTYIGTKCSIVYINKIGSSGSLFDKKPVMFFLKRIWAK